MPLPVTLTAGLLPLMLVPLLMAVLCGACLLQQPHPSLRLLLLASLCAALGLPLVFGHALPSGHAHPVSPAGTAFGLLAAALYWQAIAGLLGRRPRLIWLAAAPLVWLSLCALPWLRSGWNLLAAAVVIDHVLTLLCLMALIRAPHRPTVHRALIAVTILHPLVTFLFLVTVAVPGLPVGSETMAVVLMAETLVRVVLWPGFGLMMVLEMATLRDDLSGVLNRRGFWQAAEKLHDRTILLFDIDHFKRINDTLGHATGDLVIRRFTRLATEALGEETIFGRIGGEEFAAALEGTTPAQARRLAERVRITFADTEDPGSATVSIGISISIPDSPGQSLGDQLALADRALYRAKRLGRNRTVMHVDDCTNVVGAPEIGRSPKRRRLRDL